MNKKYEDFINRQKTSKIFERVNTDTFAGKAIIACRAKLQGSLGDNGYLLMNLLNIIELMFLHDKFQSLGIYITDENREEKYIEIIEKDDEQLLNDLEKYITLCDDISHLITEKNNYQKIVDEIQMVEPDDKDAIVSIVKDFIKKNED